MFSRRFASMFKRRIIMIIFIQFKSLNFRKFSELLVSGQLSISSDESTSISEDRFTE